VNQCFFPVTKYVLPVTIMGARNVLEQDNCRQIFKNGSRKFIVVVTLKNVRDNI